MQHGLPMQAPQEESGVTVQKYLLWHCTRCGYFFKKIRGGFVREGLRGQQSDVIDFVCPDCKDRGGSTQSQAGNLEERWK